MRGLKYAVLIVFILTGGLAFGQLVFYSNPVIKEIRFEGLVNTKPSDLLPMIYIKEGDDFDIAAANKSMKILFSLDGFNDVKLDVEETEDGLIVTFICSENQYINNILFEGNKAVRRDDLLEVIALSEYSYFTEDKLKKTIQAISKKYEEEGFVEVALSYELVKLDDVDSYDLKINVVEGKKIVVEEIHITGAVEIPEGDIKAVMKTKVKIFIIQSGILKEEDFYQDSQNIIMFYNQKGFLDAELNEFKWETEVRTNRQGNEYKIIAVYIDVTEGEKYYTGTISIKENTIFSTDELMNYIALKEGDVYDKIQMDLARYNIYNRYSDNGHLYANVSLIINKDTTNMVVDTEFVIYEGPKAHIESISITGNDKTKTYVIERELIFSEGELYIQRKVRQSYERLMRLQYFSDVQFLPAPGSAEGLVGLNIEVVEQRTGLITFGAGYGTQSGLNASAQISEKNMFGTGRILTFRGEFGIRRKLLELSFQEPWLFNTSTFAGISFSFSSTKSTPVAADDDGDGFLDFTTNTFSYINNTNSINITSTNFYFIEALSVGFNISRRFWIYWTTYLNYRFSMARKVGANFTLPLEFKATWVTNTGLIEDLQKGFEFKYTMGIGIGRNSTDNPLNPLRGYTMNFDFFYNGGIFGGDINYLRPKASFNLYWNPFWKIVLAFHVSTEFLLPQFGRNGVFLTNDYKDEDKLWFDGVYEMRGWQNMADRGESKVFYSSELRFQIYQQELWGLLFFDIGNLWANYNEWSFQRYGYLYSFGIGIKVNIPMLPIRLYLARKGSYYADEERWRLQGEEEFFKNWQFVFSIQGLF